MPPKDKSQVLPAKENALFKQLVQFYERKHYKKGVKAADTILKKHPEHGETLAMKGLTINCLGEDRKEEAYELVKKGIKFNMMSHVCWHVYGLLYRSDRQYNQAIKSYNQALKMDKDNLQILRDLALLQIHMRDLHGGLKTRNTLLTLKPTQRANWMGFAMANHMLCRYETAVKVIEAYEAIGEDEAGYELSELLLYKNSIMEEAGKLSEAYEHLVANEDKICDKLALIEKKAELLLLLGRNEEAAAVYRELIDRNVDNINYHKALVKALGLCEDAEARLLEEYLGPGGLREQYPSSNSPLRIILDFTSGDSFKSCADIYVRKFLRRGIQSLFSDLKPLYTHPDKVSALESLYQELHTSLQSTGKFPATQDEPEPKEEGPMVIKWLLLLLGNHYDRVGQPVRALECVEEGVEHTPTCIELQLCKARVLKHHGDIQQAAQVIDGARRMDLADRYLNTRCTVYALRADQTEAAEKVVVLFTKEELTGGTNLYDMQCMWWEIETGNSFVRQGRYGEALKKLTSVEKHLDDIHEDQFDFHGYCLRKMTLRSYMAMLRALEQVRTNKFFLKAAQSVIGVCVDLHDNPPPVVDPDAEFAGLDDKERKKAMKKRQKEEKKKAEALEKEKQEHAKNKRKGPFDEDPKGETQLAKLLEEGPLTLAKQYVRLLQQAWPNKVITHVLAYKVYSRLGKFVLCAQALLRASQIDATSPELHTCIVDFCSFEIPESVAPVVAEVVREVCQELLGDSSSVQGLVQQFRESCSTTLQRIAASKSWVKTEPTQQDQAIDFVSSLDGVPLVWQDAVEVHQLLVSWIGEQDPRAKSYYQSCADLFPISTYFHPGETPSEA